MLRHFSQRREEIEERAAELAGTEVGGLSRERMQGIALATRQPKTENPELGDWRAVARARAAEQGFGASELAARTAGSPTVDTEPDLEALYRRLSGPSGLTEMHNTFARRHALAEIAGAFAGGASMWQLEETTDRYLADPSVLPVVAGAELPVFTTEGLLACERSIVGVSERRDRQVALLTADAAASAGAPDQPALNADQAAAVRALTSSGHGVDVVSALAGTWLGALAGRHPGPQLREVIRQRDQAERAALEALHDGHPDRYLDHKHDAITITHTALPNRPADCRLPALRTAPCPRHHPPLSRSGTSNSSAASHDARPDIAPSLSSCAPAPSRSRLLVRPSSSTGHLLARPSRSVSESGPAPPNTRAVCRPSEPAARGEAEATAAGPRRPLSIKLSANLHDVGMGKDRHSMAIIGRARLLN